MTDMLTSTLAVQGCGVTATGTPDMDVHVAAGFVMVENVTLAVTATTITITTADATQDRQDAIVVGDTGAASVIDGDINDGANAIPPDTTGYVLLAYVYVFNQAHEAYTGTITDDEILDKREFVDILEPSNSMIYTNLAGGQTDTDPGAGNLGFNNSTFSATTKIFASYLTPTVAHDNRDWLSIVTPYWLRFFDRFNPEAWALYKVTGATNHTNYVTLDVLFENAGTTIGTVGARGGLAQSTLGTESAGLAAERLPAPPSGTNGTAGIGGDVTTTTANTFYDGPTTGSIGAAGQVWMLEGRITYVAPATLGKLSVKLWDGTTTYSEQETSMAASSVASLGVSAIVTQTGAATYKISATYTANGGTIKRDAPDNSAGAHVASILNWVRLA